ncbi:maleylacetate reductase [Penicillium herquei]|nr:maleylacetate reductase [Penicillium herquei]
MLQKERIQQFDVPYRQGFDAIFNSNAQDDISAALSKWECNRVLLVVSRAMATTSAKDQISALRTMLGARLVDTKIGVISHPPYSEVQNISHRIQNLNIDCVISVGSSSYTDACKTGSLLAANLEPGFSVNDIEALIDESRGFADSKDGQPLKLRTCKLIAVPTGLGGAEWNSVSSAVNMKGKKQHFGFWDKGQVDLALLDPSIAITSPEDLWLSGGMRCIDHCVELICNPLSAGKGMEELHVFEERGLQLLLNGMTEFKRLKAQSDWHESRDGILLGISDCQHGARDAIAGLMIWRVPLGPSHAIGHQLGPLAHILHGITSCIMLSPTLRWQAARLDKPWYIASQKRLLAIFNETLGWQESSLGDAVERFVKSLELPTTLKEIGMTSDEQIHELAVKTMTDVWGGGKRQLEFDQVLEIIESARG